MKISRKVRDNFALYLRCFDAFGRGGFNPWSCDDMAPYDAGGGTALECFKLLDCEGRSVPCREPEVLAKARAGKELLNFNVKQWAEGIRDELFCIGEFRESYPWLPRWVWCAVRGQLENPKVGEWAFPWYAAIIGSRIVPPI